MNLVVGPDIDPSHFLKLITVAEVEKRLRLVKKGSAAGPDGVTKDVLLLWDPDMSKTTRLFNTWLVAGYVPGAFKTNRTTLIPKVPEVEKLSDVNNWRPITIGPMLNRLFAKVVHKRMEKACRINSRQRGFIAAAGCAENSLILNGLMKLRRDEKRPLGVVFIDFAKAFDSVSHDHLWASLDSRGADVHLIKLLKALYTDCNTKIMTQGKLTKEILLKVGVKQGCPLSPLLFNLAIDPLLYTLERHGLGVEVNGVNVAALAFADDLVLVSDSVEGMGRSLAILEEFSALTGLKVQPRKCFGFYVSHHRGLYSLNEGVDWSLGGVPLQLIKGGDPRKYLGLKIDPWVGAITPRFEEEVMKWITLIESNPLVPMERVDVLNNYALQRLLYHADLTTRSGKEMEGADRRVKDAVKTRV